MVNDSKKFPLELSCEDSDSANSKWEIMGLDEHLQASTMVGLVGKYRGASNYLNDKTNPSQVSRVLVFRAKCREERLDSKDFPTGDVPSLVEETKSTHVVTSVTYGAEAYCVLTQDLGTKLVDEEAREEAQDEAKKNLSDWWSKLSDALEEKQNAADFQQGFNDEEKQSVSRIKCRLYADLQTQAVRECSVIDAYKHFTKLIEEVKITDEESRAIPISIVLCPLKRMMGSVKGKQLQYRDVDSDLVLRCCRILTKLDGVSGEAEMIRATNKNIRTALRPFIEAIDNFQVLLKKELKTAVVKARESDEAEEGDEELEKIVDVVEKHPLFKLSVLKRWLEYKKAESEILEKLSKTKGIALFGSQTLLTNELADSEKKYTLVLSVASVDQQTKDILIKMKECVKSNQIFAGRPSDEDSEEDEIENGKDLPWHMDRRKRKQVLDKIREFADYVENNKHLEDKVSFWMVIGDVSKGLCRYSVYESDNVLKENIVLPRPPTTLKIKAKTSSFVQVEWDHEELGYPFQYLVEYRLKDDDSWKQQKTKPVENRVAINLKEESEMEIRVATDTCIGRSEFSDTIVTDTDQNDIEIDRQITVTPDANVQFKSPEEIPKPTERKQQSTSMDLKPVIKVEAQPARPREREQLKKSTSVATNSIFKGIDRSDCIEMAALGRRIELGNLYDYRNDKVTGTYHEIIDRNSD